MLFDIRLHISSSSSWQCFTLLIYSHQWIRVLNDERVKWLVENDFFPLFVGDYFFSSLFRFHSSRSCEHFLICFFCSQHIIYCCCCCTYVIWHLYIFLVHLSLVFYLPRSTGIKNIPINKYEMKFHMNSWSHFSYIEIYGMKNQKKKNIILIIRFRYIYFCHSFFLSRKQSNNWTG